MIKLIVADDDPFIRASFKYILDQDPGIEVLDTFGNGEEAYSYCLRTKDVDLVLMDIRMPVCDGVESAKKIKRDRPDVHIVILTTFDDDDYIVEALKHGVNGYLLKNISPGQIIEGIKMVMQGHMLVHPDVAKKNCRSSCSKRPKRPKISQNSELPRRNSRSSKTLPKASPTRKSRKGCISAKEPSKITSPKYCKSFTCATARKSPFFLFEP